MSLLLKSWTRCRLGCEYKIFKNCPTLKVFSTRSVSSLKENSDQESSKTFKEIYRFKYIVLGRALNKLKWVQTLLSAVTIPASATMYYAEIFDFDMLLGAIVGSVFFTVNLYVYGSFFNKAVGFMYLSEDNLTLKISYLDFWGERVDEEVPVEEVMTLTDASPSVADRVYRSVEIFSNENLKPKIFFKFGGKVTDESRFIKVFGDYRIKEQ